VHLHVRDVSNGPMHRPLVRMDRDVTAEQSDTSVPDSATTPSHGQPAACLAVSDACALCTTPLPFHPNPNPKLTKLPSQDPTDSVSYLCAWLALVPQGLCVVYATLIWSSREAEILLMFAGQMACEAFNWILKRYIKEERPRRRSSLYSFGESSS
jgi:hypothetical protein